MKLKLRENADINIVTGISDIIIDSINKKWDNIRDLNSIIVNLNEEGFEELVPVIESVLEDENKNVGKLQQLVELISPTAKSIDDGRQEAIDELDNTEDIKVEEMKLNETFDNVPDYNASRDVDADLNADSSFIKANEEHDENKKEFEDALKENEKLANETIPKEGETGKKVTSKALKSMHLSESLFDEDLEQEEQWDFNSDVYNALSDVGFKWRNKHVTPDEWTSALEWFEIHFIEDGEWEEYNESLNEGFDDKKKVLEKGLIKFLARQEFEKKIKISNNDKKEFISRCLKMLAKYFAKDEKVTKEEVADLVNRWFKMSFTDNGNLMTESVKFDIAKEQIKRFKEGRMPKDWSPNEYVKELVSKNHLTKEEGERLLSENLTEDLNSVEDFRKSIKRSLYDLKRAYYELGNMDKDSFELSASLINTLVFELSELDKSMQSFEWNEND